MKDFLERGEYAYFPEVILSMNVGLYDAIQDFENLADAIDSAGKGFNSKVGKIKINFKSDEIRSSDIFIADLTGCRHNVMVEVGYALNSSKSRLDKLNPDKWRMLFYFTPTSEHPDPPFDLKGFRYEQINDSAEIESKVKPRLESILNEIS